MKTLMTLFVLFFSSSVFANIYNYHCDLNIVYKNSGSFKWEDKYTKFTFTIYDNDILKIYDHEINLTYLDEFIISSNNPLIAIYADQFEVSTIVIDIFTGQTTYSISYLDDIDHGQYAIGNCIKQ